MPSTAAQVGGGRPPGPSRGAAQAASAAWALAALAALAAPSPGLAAAPATTVRTVAPVADGYVTAASPERNFGRSGQIRVDGSPRARGYLRFDLRGVGGPVLRATLRVFARSSGAQGPTVLGVPDSRWDERSLSFANAPPPSARRVAATSAVRAGRWLAIDVTPLVRAGGLVSLALTSAGPTAVGFASREQPGRTPRLVVEVRGSAQAPVQPPTTTPAPEPEQAPEPGPPTASPLPELTGSIRAAFYYPWFPEAWKQRGLSPFTKWNPSAGYYDSRDAGLITRHIAAMQYGHIQAGIVSWWGKGTRSDGRIPTILAASEASGFRWALYQEGEGQGDPSAEAIRADLAYIRDRYADDPGYLRRDGRFVVFVYAQPSDGCGMADRWKEANTVGAFVVLKVFPGYRSCASQPDGWHQYAPANAEDGQRGQSYSISPGFDLAGDPAPRLVRDLPRWRAAIRNMIASRAPFQLVTTFNEWGEGTAVESAAEWASPSGHGAYLDALHDNGAGPAAGAPVAPVNSAPPGIAGRAEAGQTLTANQGAWSGDPPISYAYQWRRCDAAGTACADIAGASGAAYAPSAEDVGATLRVSVTAANAAGSSVAGSPPSAVVALVPAAAAGTGSDPVIATAGDIACDPVAANFNAGVGTATGCRMRATSDLLMSGDLAGILTLGDIQYENGAADKFLQSFDPTWGRVKGLIHPAVGNHEYLTSGAAGYFEYFGAAAGDPARGYYSFDVGSWHLIALNSNCSKVGGCGAGSPQESWLRSDLAAHPTDCTLAYWHHPRFSSGEHGSFASTQPLWQALYDAGAEIVLSGHDHDYERFGPQNAAGAPDPERGIRQFVVGTGGRNRYALGAPLANSEARDAATFGVLRLTLRPTGYDWRFVPEAGGSFTDVGSGACHGGTAVSASAVPGSRAKADTVPPTLGMPPDQLVEAAGHRGTAVTYAVSARDERDGAPAVSCAPASGARFPLGATAVRCRAADAAGNAAAGSFTVTVRDTVPPRLALPPSSVLQATGPEGAPLTYVASATDAVDGRLAVSCTGPGGAAFPIGTSTVTCSAADGAGDATTGSFTVTVVTQGTQLAGTPAAPAPPSPPRLVLTIAGRRTARAGQILTYRALVRNAGALPAPGVLLRGRLPAGFMLARPFAGVQRGPQLAVGLGNLAPGGARRLVVRLRAGRRAIGPRTITIQLRSPRASPRTASATVLVRRAASAPRSR
jgi:uncharacterized repeat protein (TIGR01451 family)